MHIFIKSNSTYPVEVQSTDKIISIKNQIFQIEGINVESQCLSYEQFNLQNNKYIEDYNIQAGSTIHVNLEIVGGGVSKYLYKF